MIAARPAAGCAFLLFALAAGAAPVAASEARVVRFPDGHHLFARLVADPRQAQTSLRYYRLAGDDLADVALGNTWGMRRWSLGESGWRVQWNLEGMGYSRFRLSGSVNEFQTIDFFANLPVEARRGAFALRVTPFHESSHLGDDFIRRTGSTGFRYSVEGVRAVLSLDVSPVLRLYGGGGGLLHAIPEEGSGSLQAGFEAVSPELGWLPEHPCWLYLAQDFQWKEPAGWNLASRTEAGFRVAYAGVLRAMRAHAGYFEGPSSFGQFFAERESYFDLGLSFDF